jgi:N-acetylmuramoyl-L-alanine amidase
MPRFVVLIDRRERQARERRLGVIALVSALTIALLIIGIRLSRDRGGPVVAPTAAPVPSPPATARPLAPTPPAGQNPATTGVVPPDGRNVVCLDAGHGGIDLGNVRVEDGKIVLQEKDLTIATAQALTERLNADGVGVVMTRTGDTEANPDNLDVNGDGTVAPASGPARTSEGDDLQTRINTCNNAGADLLLSIHYNGAENHDLQGYEVWYNDKRPFSDRSLAFATLVHNELGASMKAAGYVAHDKGIGIDDFFVLGPAKLGKRVASRMPGALAEGLFLSNDEDEAFLTSAAATPAIADAYEQAIVAYFAKYPG